MPFEEDIASMKGRLVSAPAYFESAKRALGRCSQNDSERLG